MLTEDIEFKRLICQKFDPSVDYSTSDRAEIDGTFEATIFQLLAERAATLKPNSINFEEQVTGIKKDMIALERQFRQLLESAKEDVLLSFEEKAKLIAKEEFESIDFRALIHQVVKWNGLDIGLEYRPGDIRFKGTGYEKKLRCNYGHLRRYRGSDGEALDCYLSPSPNPSDRLFEITQLSPEDGDFDELKIMLGFDSLEEAQAAYLKEMTPAHFGGIKEIAIADLEQYRKPKPVEYSTAKLTERIEAALLKVFEKIAQFEEKLQFKGDILSEDEFEAIAEITENDIAAAVENWQKEESDEFSNLLSADA